MQSFCGVISFVQLVVVMIALCDGDVRFSSGMHSKDLTKDADFGSRKETHGDYVETGIEGSVKGFDQVQSENAGDRASLSTNRNSPVPVENSGRFPEHSTTHIGKTRQGQTMTVTKWHVDHNAKRVNRTSSSVLSHDGSRHSSSQKRRARQRGIYPGTYVRSRSQAKSGASSARRTPIPRRRQTYIPRTRAALKGRSLPTVYDGPIKTSKTYVYPFAGKYPQGQITVERPDNHRRTHTTSERDRNTGRRTRIVTTRQQSPYPQNLARRGSETQALSSGVDTQQTSRSQFQTNPRQSSITSNSTLPREKQFSSNSSVTSSLNRQRATQRRTWGRVRDPSRFDPKATPQRTSTGPENSSRQSYRQSVSHRHNQRHSRTFPTSQIYKPSEGNAYSSIARGTQYYPPRPNAQKPQVQRTFRRNRVSNGYSRYAGSYPQRNPYQERSSGNLFTSYDVADDGWQRRRSFSQCFASRMAQQEQPRQQIESVLTIECPNTGIDLRINGLGCQQAVQSYGQYLCYLHEYTSKECCETCIHRKRPEQVGCEYGDHARLCNSISSSDCYDRRNEMSCCQTCARFKKIGAPEMCQWGDMIGSQRCEEVRRNPGLCYMPDNARLCCETCNIMKSFTNPTCPWGDQNARMCQIFGPTGDVLINCYSPYRRRLCCESCERLKQWLPRNMPNDCEYGDRPVIFNTGQFGRVNCAQILQYVSVAECRDNPVISRNCCYTCQRYLNTTSTSLL